MKIFLSKYFLGKKKLVSHIVSLPWDHFNAASFMIKENPSLPSAVIFKHVLAVRKWSEELKSDHTQYLVIALPVQYRTSECFSHLFGMCTGSAWNVGAGRGSQFLAVNTHPGLALTVCLRQSGVCNILRFCWKKIQTMKVGRATMLLGTWRADFRAHCRWVLPHSSYTALESGPWGWCRLTGWLRRFLH